MQLLHRAKVAVIVRGILQCAIVSARPVTSSPTRTRTPRIRGLSANLSFVFKQLRLPWNHHSLTQPPSAK